MALMSLWIALLFSPALGNDLVIVGQTFMAGSADPTDGSTGWALTSHGIGEKLFTVDEDGNIVGQVAESVRKLDQLSWEVTLKCDYKFSDGTPVTAERVAAALSRLNAENAGASASLGDMTMTVLSDFKLKIQSERATPVMAAVLAEWPFVIFLEKGDDFLFTGPYEIETFWAGEQIVLKPNEYYPRAADRKHLTIKKFADGDSLADALEAGEVDMAFHLPVDKLTELRAADGITMKSFPVGYQYMMFHNMRAGKPLSTLEVRKAVDAVLDRTALSQELRGGDATRSFFPQNTPYHYEPEGAKLHGQQADADALLDQAGWLRSGGTGNREKDGVPLTLRVVAYPQRPGLAIMHPVVGAALESLGITVDLKLTSGASWDELDEIMANGDYDLLMWAQHTLPAGDPQWFLSHFFRSDSGGNHAGFNSPDVDNLIDALSSAETGTNRVAATTSAHRAILEQVPVSVLITPDWHVGFGSRLADYTPWGSDYYIIRADFGVAPQQGGNEPVVCNEIVVESDDDGTESGTTRTTTTSTSTGNESETADVADKMMPSGILVASVSLLGWTS